MDFKESYFKQFKFSKTDIKKNLNNAVRDLRIAKKDNIPEVKFNYCYTALIKAGLALLSLYQVKVKSVPGHHIKVIEKISEILQDKTIEDIGNAMRSKRNLDFYNGGIEVTEKECREFILFAGAVLSKVQNIISRRL